MKPNYRRYAPLTALLLFGANGEGLAQNLPTPQTSPVTAPATTTAAATQPAGAQPTSRPVGERPPVRLAPLSAALDASPAEVEAPSRAELARRVEILTDEVTRLREQIVLPETEQLKSSFGLGPAASRVYRTKRGISLGGYGEFHLEQKAGDSERGKDFSIGDYLRYVQYVGYKFTDKLLVNFEIEFEHATTGTNFADQGGSVSVEFASLEYLAHRWINIRAGLLLVPMGFVNEMHEPPFFHGNLRPEVETRIIPSTWRELGLGVFGEPVPGLSYKLYVVNGLNAEKFGEAGWRGGRQKGGRALVEDYAFVFNLAYQWRNLLQLGGSIYYGGADQSRLGDASVNTLLMEGHLQLRWAGLELRGLASYGALSDAAALSQAVYPDPEQAGETETRLVGSEVFGWYAELAYDLWPWLSNTSLYLAPYFRFEQYDSQADVPSIEGRSKNLDSKRQVIEAGLTFKPHPQIVLKGSYRNIDGGSDQPLADSFYFGAGFIY